jgi:hypothetical protein
MYQTVSRRPLITEVRVRYRANQRGNYAKPSNPGPPYSPSTLVMFCPLYEFYIQLLQEASFYAATCFGYLLYPSSGSYSIINTQSAYGMSVNGEHIYISFL